MCVRDFEMTLLLEIVFHQKDIYIVTTVDVLLLVYLR